MRVASVCSDGVAALFQFSSLWVAGRSRVVLVVVYHQCPVVIYILPKGQDNARALVDIECQFYTGRKKKLIQGLIPISSVVSMVFPQI